MHATSIITLSHSLSRSFTIEAWVHLEAGYPTTKMPIICTLDGNMCMYISGGVLEGRLGNTKAVGVTTIADNTWTQLIMRYNAEGWFSGLIS